MTKVAIIRGNLHYSNMFAEKGFEVVTTIEDADLVCFTGGADVDPGLYGEGKHPNTQYSAERDAYDIMCYEKALQMELPMVGICRGGQFLNVMNGGTLYQDADGHANGGNHIVVDLDTQNVFLVTSTHHQIIRPHKSGKILAQCRKASFKEYVRDGKITRGVPGDVDVEAVYYPRTECLCFQPHPEFVNAKGQCRDYFFALLYQHLKVGEAG